MLYGLIRCIGTESKKKTTAIDLELKELVVLAVADSEHGHLVAVGMGCGSGLPAMTRAGPYSGQCVRGSGTRYQVTEGQGL